MSVRLGTDGTSLVPGRIAYVEHRTDLLCRKAEPAKMSAPFHSTSSQHKQAARDHELAALQHRTAAEFHDKRMLHEARLSAAEARECCVTAHGRSMIACWRSADATLEDNR